MRKLWCVLDAGVTQGFDHHGPRDNSRLKNRKATSRKNKTCCRSNRRSTEKRTSNFAHSSSSPRTRPLEQSRGAPRRREQSAVLVCGLCLLLPQPLLPPPPPPPSPVLTCVYSAHPARLLMKPHTSSTLHLLMSSPGFAVAESSPSMKRPPMEPERGSSG